MAAQKKYPDELRERAVKMLFEVREREGKGARRAGPGRTSAGCSPGGIAVVGKAGGNRRRGAARDNDG